MSEEEAHPKSASDGKVRRDDWISSLPSQTRKKRFLGMTRRSSVSGTVMPASQACSMNQTNGSYEKKEGKEEKEVKEKQEDGFGSESWCDALANSKVDRKDAERLCDLHARVEALIERHHESEQTNEESPSDRQEVEARHKRSKRQKPKILTTGSLSDAASAKLKQLCRTHGFKCTTVFDKDVTHLVTKGDQGRCQTRSMKYLTCVMHGCWIVDEKWVLDSAEEGSLQPEDAYEIEGDTFAEGAPKKSRQNPGSRQIFSGYAFHIAGKKKALQNETISHIIQCIELGGGKLVDRPAAPDAESGSSPQRKTIVLCEPKAPKTVLLSLKKKWGVDPISYRWVLNSISRFEAVKDDEKHEYILQETG